MHASSDAVPVLILSRAAAFASLYARGGGLLVEQDRRIFKPTDRELRQIFGDDASADVDQYFAASEPWRPRRVMMIGRRASENLTAEGWDVVLLDDTRVVAQQADVQIQVVADQSGILAERTVAGVMSEGGHTVDVGAIEDAVTAWSKGAVASPPDDSTDWVSAAVPEGEGR